MRRRIQGTEHEYTLYNRRMEERGIDPHQLALELLRRSSLHSAGEFTTNQSRAYYDVGHLEISTCETSSPFDALRWEKAGEKIVDWLRKEVEERYCSRASHLWAYKNNTAPDGTSYGSHENYIVDRSVEFPGRFVRELVPHLVTRIIYTGAGDILNGKYVLSPSAYLTGTLVSGDTMHNTGVLNTRDEAHADEGRYRRLHLQVGDALMGEWAILFRQFTTSAVIELMERGRLADAPKLSQPVEDLWHNVEQTNPEKWTVHLDGGKAVSPLEIQRYYLEKIESIAEKPEEKRVLRALEELLGDIENRRTAKLAHRIEWLDRYLAVQEAAAGDDDPEAEMKACKRYSELSEGRGIYHERVRKGLVDRFLDDRAVLGAITAPPSDTRAALRLELCRKYEVERIDWAFVVVGNGDGSSRRIDLEDPYALSEPEVKSHG